MRISSFALSVLLAAIPAVCAAQETPGTPLVYPPAPRGPVVDTYFGTPVADPYRWLENVDAPQTTAWVKAENALTRSYLDAIPGRGAIAAAYRKLYDYERVSAPFRAGSRWFFFRNSGLQTQAVLYVRKSENGTPRLFFDANGLSKDGTVQLAATNFSHDGSLMAYATQTGGSDWLTWHVKSVATGRDLPDVIHWSKFSSAAWVGNEGFYYEGYDAPKAANKTLATLDEQKVWFHRLGTPQSRDRFVYASKSPQFVSLELTQDQRFVFLEPGVGDGNGLLWKARGEPDHAFRTVFPVTDNVQYAILGNDGSRIYVQTNRDAPHQRIAWFDLTDPAHVLHDIVPQSGDRIDSAVLVRQNLYVEQLHDAHSVLRVVGLDGRERTPIALPTIGVVALAPALRENPAVYYTFESIAYPRVVFRYSLAAAKSVATFRSPIAFDPSAFVTEQIFTTSKDGTRVPTLVAHRKDMPLDGSTPTILYGYGGFDISQLPYFSTGTALWLQMGGAYAMATLRGGGEYGAAWHEGGMLLHKQNVFDDFIASAQMLIDRKITSTPKLAIDGGSNGGLLVGATLTQRPELFGAAIIEQGVLDMLRYQKFTVGSAWIPEYGSAEASQEQFKALLAYSPLATIKDGTHYPPTLVTTADHDDRVFPAHSFKFTAALQHAQAGGAPILLRVQTNEGHFSGLTTDQRVNLEADMDAFLARSLNFTPRL